MRATDDPAIKAIAKINPVKLKVRVTDEREPVIVSIPNNRKKYDIVRRTLESLNWETVECQDKDGKLLGPVIEREADDVDEEFYDDEEEPATSGMLRAVLRDAMRVNLEIMRTTMKETRQIFDAQTKSQSELVGVMVEGLRAVQESYSIAMRVQTAQLVGGGDAGGSEMQEMMKMALMVGMQKNAAPPAAPPRPAPRPPAPRPVINVPPTKEPTKEG